MFTLDPSGRISSWSGAVREAFGYEADDFVGKRFSDVFGVPDQGDDDRVLESARSDGTAVLAGWRLGKSGRKALVSGHVTRLHSDSRQETGFAVVMTRMRSDDGRSSRVEPVPRDADQLVTEAVWSIREPFYVLDESLHYTYANKRCETMWGVPLEQMIGRHVLEVFPQLQDSEFFARHLEALREKKPIHFEAYSPIRGRTVDALVQPVTGGIAAVIRDPFDMAVNLDDERHGMPASALDVAVHRFEPETGSLIAVGDLTDVFGLPAGKRFTSLEEKLELMVHNDRMAYERTIAEAISQGQPWRAEYRAVRPRDGATVWLAEQGTLDETDDQSVYVVMTWDITTLRRIEEQLRAGQRRLRRELLVNRLVYDVLAKAGGVDDPREGVEMLLEASVELIGGERGGIWLLDRKDERLRVFAQRGFGGGYLSEFGDIRANVEELDQHAPGGLLTSAVPADQLEALAEDGIDASSVRSEKVTLPGANGRAIGQLCIHVPAERPRNERDYYALRLMAMQAATLAERYMMEELSDELLRRMEENARAAGDALLESEIRFRRAFELGPVAAVISTLDEDRFLEVNEHYTKLTGYDREEVIGRTARELGMWSSPEDRQRLEHAFAVGGNFKELQLRLRTKDGRIRDILLSGEEISYGGYRCMLKMFNDITDEHRSQEELMTAIREVMSDTEWFSQSVVQRLAEIRQGEQQVPEDLDLTPREREVLEFVAAGLSDEEVAEQLGISQRTARNHLTNAYSKIGAHNRAEAIVWARERGLVARVSG